jgi:predicted aminopeptidase
MLLTKHRLPPLRCLAALLPAALVACALPGCGTAYLAQAAGGQLEVMNAREPIEEVLARPDTDAALREQLLRASRIREFASRELGLPDNGAYRSYADIDRPYVVWNVVATPELSAAPRQWCFPIAGCVAYRGYFREDAARDFAAGLAARGDDTTVGGVPAYSTLGRIEDPLLSTVNRYPEIDLAALIFHELAHQVLYVPGDSGFNEAFATAVEEEGVARYVAAYLDPQALASWQRRRAHRQQAVELMAAARRELEAVYDSARPDAEKRELKAARLAQLATELQALEARTGQRYFASWVKEGLNNAHLASVATYYDQVPMFEALLRERCGGYLPCFYVEAAREAQKKGPQASGGG